MFTYYKAPRLENKKKGYDTRNRVYICRWLSRVLGLSLQPTSRLFSESGYDPETVRKYLEKQGFSTKRVRSPVRAQLNTQQK